MQSVFAGAENADVFVSVKKCVTDRAVADPFAFEFGQALYARCEPSAAGRQKYRLAHVLFVVRGDDGESAVLIINRLSPAAITVVSRPLRIVYNAAEMPAGPAPIMITSDIQKLSLQNKIKQIFKSYYSYIISVLC